MNLIKKEDKKKKVQQAQSSKNNNTSFTTNVMSRNGNYYDSSIETDVDTSFMETFDELIQEYSNDEGTDV